MADCFKYGNELPVFIKLPSQEVLCSMELLIVLMEMRERGCLKSMNRKTVDNSSDIYL